MNKGSEQNKITVGISCGDLNGIGLEVVIKTFSDARMLQQVTPVVYASSKSANAYRKLLEVKDFSFHSIKDASEAHGKKVNLINCWDEEVNLQLGTPSAEVAKYALTSLERAASDLAAGKVDVLVTAPIDKKTIQSEDFDFPGHTEYLANMANVDDALMLMVCEDLRVGVVTGHIPLKDVSGVLSKDLVYQKLQQLNASLVRDFGIRRPRIALLGLNPHAGEQGLLGEEDGSIITPVVNRAREEGMLAMGPYPADGFFGSSTFKKFDGVLAMYHDQGLAPFKALSFGFGVNYTAGLPIVRTSPDHGTGYDIAGKNEANDASFRAAVFLAVDVYKARRIHREITANPLVSQKKDR